MNIILIGKEARNYKHGRYCKNKHYYCLDCKKEITPNSIRCKKCMYVYRTKINWHPKNYKGGFAYCVDCGKQTCGWRAKRCASCASKIKAKNNWKNKNYRNKVIAVLLQNQQKIIKILHNKPNKIEKQLIQLLPKSFIFVGDGKFMIDRFNPDFINKRKKLIIELFGDYWHNRIDYIKRDKRRLKTYKKYGYKTLIIWEHELKNLNQLVNKINNFNKIRKRL